MAEGSRPLLFPSVVEYAEELRSNHQEWVEEEESEEDDVGCGNGYVARIDVGAEPGPAVLVVNVPLSRYPLEDLLGEWKHAKSVTLNNNGLTSEFNVGLLREAEIISLRSNAIKRFFGFNYLPLKCFFMGENDAIESLPRSFYFGLLNLRKLELRGCSGLSLEIPEKKKEKKEKACALPRLQEFTASDIPGIDGAGPSWLFCSAKKRAKHLERLTLRNGVVAISKEISNLKGLRELKIEHDRYHTENSLPGIPEPVYTLQQLEVLEIHSTASPFVALSDSLGQLTALRKLCIQVENGTETGVFPGLTLNVVKCTKLDKIQIVGAGMTLFLSPSPLDRIDSSHLSRLVHLQTLDLAYNCLETLPEEIGSLVNLQLFKVNNNKLRTLPETLSALKQLQELDVTCNCLGGLPYAIGNCSSLVKLSIGENRMLRVLPDSLCNLTNLVTLNIGSSGLGKYYGLHRKDSEQTAVYLPENFGELVSLKLLTVDNIKVFPRSFSKLENLEHVYYVASSTVLYPPCTAIESFAQGRKFRTHRHRLRYYASKRASNIRKYCKEHKMPLRACQHHRTENLWSLVRLLFIGVKAKAKESQCDISRIPEELVRCISKFIIACPYVVPRS